MGLLSLALGLAGSAAAQLQLTFSVGQPGVRINGQGAQITAPQIVDGRTMLPLNDTVLLLGYHLTRNGNVVSVVGGDLAVDLGSGYATVRGQRQGAGNVAVLNGKLFVSARVIAAGLGGELSVGDGSVLTLSAQPRGAFVPRPPATPQPAAPTPTAPRPSFPAPSPAPVPGPVQPAPPQARFSTDKASYAPGERIIWTEYSYDPEGGGLTARNWTGKQDVYWAPGNYAVSLQVTNGKGQTSAPFSRTIRVQGAAVDTPVTHALRYGQIGDRFADSRVLTYPALTMGQLSPRPVPLLFSDSPEKPQQSGVLYQDQVSGEARLLGYHVNDLGRPARMYIMIRNLESRPVSVALNRQGETAPSRIEGILGQVTLMDYFSSPARSTVNLAPGQVSALYASPTLNPGHGVSILQDLQSSGRVVVSFVMAEASLPMNDATLRSLPYLPLDGRHQRGTFQGADRPMTAQLGQLPARVVIGDGQHDPVLTGRDTVTGAGQRLAGNYGVLYDMEFTGASGTAIALSPRGGLYRGAMRIIDGDLTQVIKLPREGNALTPDEPHLLWRAKSDRVRIQFMPSNGSALPVNLVFYRLPEGTYKWYQP
ncbi:copper amine oxidase N-terminal domain-containing protein [Deinococcus radiophilus]|uniref:Copper amine oxidase N-terminal domain-containing protein n=3 Tax=Deinococcus radiophilus TaxID=32062 RepID=A0A3S0KG31_9DEIO|nr:copper amine oxidase N-terminal domain-containing protein [Deinococcus radiophilus]